MNKTNKFNWIKKKNGEINQITKIKKMEELITHKTIKKNQMRG